MEAPGCTAEAEHDCELDDTAVPEILRQVPRADARGVCEAGGDPRRRNGTPYAEGGGQGPNFEIQNEGIRLLQAGG